MLNCPDLKGWLPFKVQDVENKPIVDWCQFGQKRLLQPFFENAVSEQFKLPFNVLFRHQTPIEILSSWRAESPGIPPTGFIFHLSRCGSTLVSQMLAASELNVVTSEPPPVDHVIRCARLAGVDEEQRISWLQGMISALGQRRSGNESRFFVKFDSWHLLDLALVRKAFPDVPWIVIFRDPVEILVSQMDSPAFHSAPGLVKFGPEDLDTAQAGLVSREEYCSLLLSHLCKNALTQLNEPKCLGIAVNYREHPGATLTRIAQHFGLELSAEEKVAMEAATILHAKAKLTPFEPDSIRKQNNATPAIKAAVEKHLTTLYTQLCTAATVA